MRVQIMAALRTALAHGRDGRSDNDPPRAVHATSVAAAQDPEGLPARRVTLRFPHVAIAKARMIGLCQQLTDSLQSARLRRDKLLITERARYNDLSERMLCLSCGHEACPGGGDAELHVNV